MPLRGGHRLMFSTLPVDIITDMSDCAAHIDSLLAGIISCPPAAHSTVRLIAGPDVKRFNRLFDDSTDLLMDICRNARQPADGNRRQTAALPAEEMADLMLVLALQMSLIAGHLADSMEWGAGSLKEILENLLGLPFPLRFLFKPDCRFWEAVLRHSHAPVFLETFKTLDEHTRLRCVAVMTCSPDPSAEIDRFLESPDPVSFVSGRLSSAAVSARNTRIDNLSELKKAIAWSIAASSEHPTLDTTR